MIKKQCLITNNLGGVIKPFIQINMLEGRTIEQKRKLVKLVTKSVSDSLEISENNVTIIIKDVPKTNFSQGGELAADKK